MWFSWVFSELKWLCIGNLSSGLFFFFFQIESSYDSISFCCFDIAHIRKLFPCYRYKKFCHLVGILWMCLNNIYTLFERSFVLASSSWIRERNGFSFRENKVWILCLGSLHFLSALPVPFSMSLSLLPWHFNVLLLYSYFFLFFIINWDFPLYHIAVTVQSTFEGKIERCFIICIKCLWCTKKKL